MIDREILKEYIEILEKYNINTNDFLFSERESYIINLINSEMNNNNEFREFINNLINSNNKDYLIEEYFNNLNSVNDNSEEEVIADVFGIDISKVGHKYLDNGKEIFSFYDVKNGRPVVMENKKTGKSLVEQLKEIQSQNTEYQTSNDEKNVQYILEDKSFKENCELSMIPINEINKHLNEINNLSIEDLKKLNFLIKNLYSLGIVSINIENLIALDKDGKIYEVYKDESLEYRIGEPNSASYNESNINTSDRVNTNYNVSEQNVALQSNFEDSPNIIENEPEDEEIQFDYLPDDIKEKTIMFYEYPNLLNDLSTEEREIWQEYLSMYNKKLEYEANELNKKNNAPKIKRYIKEDENNGYITFTNIVFIVSVILIIVTFIIVM